MQQWKTALIPDTYTKYILINAAVDAVAQLYCCTPLYFVVHS